MDLDDEQQHRHMSRYTARGLAIFYREMRYAGLPWLVAGALTVEHYRYLIRPEDATGLILDALERRHEEGEDG